MNELIPKSEFTEVKGRESGMMEGSIPSWLSTAVSGGTVTALDASNDGGYIDLDPGTTSSGDYAKISSFNLTPNAYDVVEYYGRIAATTTSSSDIKLTIGFEESSNNNVFTSWVQPSGAYNNQVQATASGTETNYDARVINDVEEHEFRLQWDTDRGEVNYWIDGFPALIGGASGLPDPSLTYFGQVTAEYNGGNAAQVQVYQLGIRYYNRG